MKWLKYVTFALCTLLFVFTNFTAKAQSALADSLLKKALSTDELLPMLIDSAIKFSPELRRIGGNQAYAQANLQINKNAIFSAVSLFTSYYYGTNYSAVSNASNPTTGNNFTTSQTGFYNLGVGLQLPITHIINRKNIIKAGQSLVNVSIAEKENAALFIKQEVIRLYQEFKLSQKLMAVSSRNKQSAEINSTMADKGFLNGQVTVDDLSRVQDIYNKATVEFETYVNKFQTSFMQLEAYTGANLTNLIMRVK